MMKRAGEAISELRRKDSFARARSCEPSAAVRAVRAGAWNQGPEQQARLRQLFAANGKLARAYQVIEELREVLRAPSRAALETGLHRHYRTEACRTCQCWKLTTRCRGALRGDRGHRLAPAMTGRLEALNTNWEALVRQARSYRDPREYLRRKLRFMIANPVRTVDGTKRFLALGLPAPLPRRRADAPAGARRRESSGGTPTTIRHASP
ncbi:MAG: transposase [Sandaracinus sp.]